MSSTIGLLLLSAMAYDGAYKATHFENYTDAYHLAQRIKLPMLVILNPGHGEEEPISLEHIRRTRHRRKLLEDYVVVCINTDTEHGKRVHELFGSGPLPSVSIIDKHQKYQIFQASEHPSGQRWNVLLESFRSGGQEATIPPQFCPT